MRNPDMWPFPRPTDEQRIAARRHRIWADLAMIARDLNALHRGNTDVLTDREAGLIGYAASSALGAARMMERNNRPCPISLTGCERRRRGAGRCRRSEEHTSELQSLMRHS